MTAERIAIANAQVDWDRLDVESYLAEHYLTLRDDDGLVLDRMAAFFAHHLDAAGSGQRRGVDVGTGANLYPTLAMLPFADEIDLLEISPTAVAWLRRQRADGFGANWDPFWQRLARQPAYRGHFSARDVRAEFRDKTDARVADAFHLPARRWDLGTMFFTACSLSTSMAESRDALRSFVESLKPGAPFVIALMLNSDGYVVEGIPFPAVPLTERHVRDGLARVATGVTVVPVRSAKPIRPDVYMAVATGFAS